MTKKFRIDSNLQMPFLKTFYSKVFYIKSEKVCDDVIATKEYKFLEVSVTSFLRLTPLLYTFLCILLIKISQYQYSALKNTGQKTNSRHKQCKKTFSRKQLV